MSAAVYEYATLTIDPERSGDFAAVLPAAERILRSAAGCRSVEFLRAIDRPEVYLLRVGWDSIEDHLERFPASPQAAELAATIGDFFVEAPFVVHFER